LASHTVLSYDEEINGLYNSLYSMGIMTRDVIGFARKAFISQDGKFADLAFETDKIVNQLDIDIEKAATRLLALRQPVGIDLRIAISALKMAVILERMGDLAKNTAKRACDVEIFPSEDVRQKIEKMFNYIINMMEEGVAAFSRNDNRKALTIPQNDDDVDMLYYEIYAQTQAEMLANPDNIPSCLQIMFAIKNIERIGDYAVKIAKMVHYIVTGEMWINKSDHNAIFSPIDRRENS
jgi:phosphate transport system protein